MWNERTHFIFHNENEWDTDIYFTFKQWTIHKYTQMVFLSSKNKWMTDGNVNIVFFFLWFDVYSKNKQINLNSKKSNKKTKTPLLLPNLISDTVFFSLSNDSRFLLLEYTEFFLAHRFL